MDAIVQRLVQNPHDQDAILYAHSAGQSDPRAYAMLLEKVGTATSDPSLASHWLTEAANVWITSLNDAHRAARAFMIAIDRDPTQAAPAERLADLYREKGDTKALAALLERRAKALAPLTQHDPNMRSHIAGIHEELGRLWSEPPLTNAQKAVENYRRAIEYDPGSVYAIYSVREALKAAGEFAEAIPYFAMEQALVADNDRRLALYQDEAEVRISIGDFDGAVATLRNARQVDPADAGLKQQLGTLVLERVRAGQPVDEGTKSEAAQLFVDLAEDYPGEHAFAYSTCALEVDEGHDRAIQLAIYYGEQLGRGHEVAPFAASYLRVNPGGALAADAQRVAGDARPRSAPKAAPAAVAPRAAAPPASEQTVEEGELFDAAAEDSSSIEALLSRASQLASRNRRNEAATVYLDVLKAEATNPDALSYLQTYFRQTRKFAQLRDVLMRAASDPETDEAAQLSYWQEIAGLCESQLRDFNTAVEAWQRIRALDPTDAQALDQLKRLLERANRWDDLTALLQEEAEATEDLEARIAMEKQLAKLHEVKRKDPIAAGEAWARLARLTPEDDQALGTAVKFFERGARPDLAAAIIAETVGQVEDLEARGALYEKLGALREGAGDTVGAGEAYGEAARLRESAKLWAKAEQCYRDVEAYEQAAIAVAEQADLAGAPPVQAALRAREADYLLKAGDAATAVTRLEQATDLDPSNDELAALLESQLTAADRMDELAQFLLRRAEKVDEKARRVALRKRAADIQREPLADLDAARESLLLVLQDGEDADALSALAEDAEQRGERGDAVDFLDRLLDVVPETNKKVDVVLRQGRLLSDGMDDLAGAIDRYRSILDRLEPKNEAALAAIAELEERRGNDEGTAMALERHLEVVETAEAKVELATRLADLYELKLDDPRSALKALHIVYEADRDDFQAVQRIADLAERLEDWATVAAYTAKLIEVEGDEEEAARMTRRQAEILHEKLGRGEEALAALATAADRGDAGCREDYVRLGDELGKKALVAEKLVAWFSHVPPSQNRDDSLHGAFDRFIEVERGEDAVNLGKQLAQMRIARIEIAEPLESVAAELKDLDALAVAHDLLVRDLSGRARADEMVRQAEVLREAGVPASEAVQHGEQALTSVSPEEVEPLLDRLAAITTEDNAIVDLYERQVGRCKAPADRLNALARAAQVAAERGAVERARSFFDLALSGAIADETLEKLEDAAREADHAADGDLLRRTLADALAAGGHGARDGGRTRGSLLRRAALLAYKELDATDQAFQWLGDGLITHVDDAGLDALDDLAQAVGDPARAEAVLSRALEEVFDGPLVRKLLGRRATVRAERLDNKVGAAEDLKRLHDLSPGDADVTARLSALYTELEDYRGMVALFEDQILRGRDQSARAELARSVARLWEERLEDPREAADAWRRVLRMKSGDPEATAGLERAKANMLKKSHEPSVVENPVPPDAGASVESEAQSGGDVVAEPQPAAEPEPAASPPAAEPQEERPASEAEAAASPSADGVEAPSDEGVGAVVAGDDEADAEAAAEDDDGESADDLVEADDFSDAAAAPADFGSGEDRPTPVGAALDEPTASALDLSATGAMPDAALARNAEFEDQTVVSDGHLPPAALRSSSPPPLPAPAEDRGSQPSSSPPPLPSQPEAASSPLGSAPPPVPPPPDPSSTPRSSAPPPLPPTGPVGMRGSGPPPPPPRRSSGPPPPPGRRSRPPPPPSRGTSSMPPAGSRRPAPPPPPGAVRRPPPPPPAFAGPGKTASNGNGAAEEDFEVVVDDGELMED